MGAEQSGDAEHKHSDYSSSGENAFYNNIFYILLNYVIAYITFYRNKEN